MALNSPEKTAGYPVRKLLKPTRGQGISEMKEMDLGVPGRNWIFDEMQLAFEFLVKVKLIYSSNLFTTNIFTANILTILLSGSGSKPTNVCLVMSRLECWIAL